MTYEQLQHDDDYDNRYLVEGDYLPTDFEDDSDYLDSLATLVDWWDCDTDDVATDGEGEGEQ